MPFDLDTLLGSDPSGLLTPQERGGVTGQGLMGMGAALLQAAAPSPYRHTTLSGLGAGVQGLVSGQNTARDQMLKQQLVRANVFDKFLPVFKSAQQYDALGMRRPPELQRMLDVFGNMVGGSPFGRGVPGAAQPGVAAQGAVSPSPGAAAAAAAAPGVPGTAPGTPPNLVVDTARDMGINRGMLMEGMPGQAISTKAIEERIHSTDPGIQAQERQQAILKAQTARHEKLYGPLVGLGQEALGHKETADISLGLTNDPEFYSGAFAPVVEGLKKLRVAFGGEPTAAAAMEVYRKVTASNVNAQITAMRSAAAEMGGAAGRVFERQAKLMEMASQNLENTPEANRFLAVMQKRAAEVNIEIGKMAQAYAEKHGILDPGFDREMTRYMENHPIYSQAELNALPHTSAGAAAQTPAASTAPQPPPAPGNFNWTPQGGTVRAP